jgi:serine protease
VPDVPTNATPAKVINMSLGGGGSCDPLLQSAITDAVNAGTVVAVAAGNSGDDAAFFQPANCNGVITVASTDRTGGRAWYSNFGATVEISAPGGDTSSAAANGVLSTLNTGTNGPVADSYAYYQGTSMAAPHVAGIVSLLFSIKPNLTPAQVLTIIQLSVTPFPSGSNCTTTNCGPGIINAAAALALAQNNFLPPSNLTALAISSTQINVTWNDNSSDETNFQIQRCQGAGCTNFSALATVGANVTSYNNTGLTAGTSYRYRVRAIKSGAQSAYSNIAGATTLGVGCSAYHSTDVPKAITDNTTVESTLAVPGSFAVGDVNVTNFRIQHTYDADLTVHLVSPSNSAVELFSDVGGSGDNFDGTRFDDSAGQSIVDGSAPFVGAYRPEGVLATLNGQPGNGTWRLRVADNYVGDRGQVLGWSLEICSVPFTLPVAPSALTSRTASSTQIALTWDDNSTNETGFKIERCQNAGCTTFAQVATVGANVSSYTNGSLLANTTHCCYLAGW